MSWRLEIERRAERELEKLPDAALQRVVERLESLKQDPFPRGIRKLQGGGYRMRVGDYRVLYDVMPREKVVIIYAVGHRRDVYRRS